MTTVPIASRSGRIVLWTAVALCVGFVGLVLYQKFLVSSQRFVSDADLLAEIASAELIDEAPDPRPWTQWRGRERAGLTSFPEMPRQWPAEGPKRLWSWPGGDGYSSFAVSEGRIFTMIETEGKERVLCLNLADGSPVWERAFTLEKTFDYGGPRATPTLADGKLYTVTSDGVLLCLRQSDGKTVWQTDTRVEADAIAPRWGFAYSPLVVGKYVYATPGGKGKCLAAFDRDSGVLVWATEDDPAGYSSPVHVTIAGVEQILFFTGQRLVSVTPDAGVRLWDYVWDTRFEVNAATPLVVRGRIGNEILTYVFISSGYSKGSALLKISSGHDGRLSAKAVYESNELCCHFASPVRYKGHLYALDETRDLTCLDLRTGKVAWRFAKADDDAPELRNRGYKKGSIVGVDDVLLILGEDGKLALVAADPKEYRELTAARPFRDRSWTTPVLADGKVILRDRKRIVCLDLRMAKRGE